jgi:Heterokaryon incompatibility protein (HET)
MKDFHSYFEKFWRPANRIGHMPRLSFWGVHQSNTGITKDESDGLCRICRKMDFQKREKRLLKLRLRKQIIDIIGTQDILEARQCRVCNFWLQLTVENFSRTTNPFWLRAISAIYKYDLSGLDRHLDVLLLEIYADSQSGKTLGVIDCAVMTRRTPGNSSTRNSEAIQCNKIPAKADISLPLSWLNYCKTHHNSCILSNSSGLPTLSVVDCENTLRTSHLQIVTLHGSFRYAALSYVWGPVQEAIHQETDSAGTRFQDLPRVIQDAITTTDQLLIRYLWVDRYCIDQQNAQVKHETIMNMNLVFKAAELTIVAAAGSSDSDGLPGVGLTPRNTQDTVEFNANTNLISLGLSPDRLIGKSTWATRGWTLQEGYLSQRRLVFTSNQLYFECNEMACEEAVALPLKTLHDYFHGYDVNRIKSIRDAYFKNLGDTLENDTNYKRFGNLLVEFTGRDLTYGSDRLNAFLGIIQWLKPDIAHIWGLPIDLTKGSDLKASFFSSLIWFYCGPKRTQRSFSEPVFPSWSWVAWKGKIQMQHYTSLSLNDEIDVIFHLSDGSSILLENSKTFRSHLHNLEANSTQELTLCTHNWVPKFLYESHVGYNGHRLWSLDNYNAIVENSVDLDIEAVKNREQLLLYVGHDNNPFSHIYFLVTRRRGNLMERVGLMQILWLRQDSNDFRRLIAEVKSQEFLTVTII